MDNFNVRAERCVCCGLCLMECPNRLILMDSETGRPKLRVYGEEDCILCGHCVAVCPKKALNIEPLPEEAFTSLNKDLQVSFEQIEQFLKSRRSIRAFKDKPVPAEVLRQIMDAARFAPTAKHKQPVSWIMLADPVKSHRAAELVIEWMEIIRKEQPEQAKYYRVAGLIAGWRRGLDMILRGAPHLAVACAPKGDIWHSSDAAIALTYVELAAHACGVGACWAGYFTQAANIYAPLREFLGLPENLEVFGAQMLGWPAVKYQRLPWRKPLDIAWL